MKRSTWILLAVVVALGAFVGFWERKQPGTAEAEKAKGRLLPASAKEATDLSRAGSDPLSLAKKGEEWELTSPVADRADRFSVSGLLDRLAEAEVTRWLEGPPAAEMGLDAPKVTWTLQSASGKSTVELGAKAALDAGLYLRVDGKVALVAASLEDALLRPLDDFRSKELLPVGSADVISFRYSAGGADRLAFSRQGDAWDLTAPFADAGDGSKLESVIEDVCACVVDSFVEDNPKEMARYGLEPAAQEIRLTAKGAETLVRLGASVPGSDPAKALVYAHASGRPTVFALSMNSLKSLTQDAEGLRLLEPFRHDTYSAKTLALSGATTLALSANQEGVWRLESPPQGVKAEEGGGLFTALASLKGEKALPAPGVTFEPYLTLTLKGEGWEEKAEVGTERGGVRLLKPAGRSVYLVVGGEAWATAEAALAVATGRVPSPKPPATHPSTKPATAADPIPAPVP